MSKLENLTQKYKQVFERILEIHIEIDKINESMDIDLDLVFSDGKASSIAVKEKTKVQDLEAELIYLESKIMPVLKLKILQAVDEKRREIITKLKSEEELLEQELAEKVAEFNIQLEKVCDLAVEIMDVGWQKYIINRLQKYRHINITQASGIQHTLDNYDIKIGKQTDMAAILSPFFNSEILEHFKDLPVKEFKSENEETPKDQLETVIENLENAVKTEGQANVDYDPELSKPYVDILMQELNIK